MVYTFWSFFCFTKLVLKILVNRKIDQFKIKLSRILLKKGHKKNKDDQHPCFQT
jgi:hypothetical protein